MIRKGTAEDVLGIAITHVRAWQSTYKGLLTDAYLESLSIEDRANYWNSIFERALGCNFVADVDQEIVVFAHIGPSRDIDKDPTRSAQLYSIYVRVEYQRQKYGRQLFDEAMRWAGSNNFKELVLYVMEHNISARGFYERMGMSTDGHTLSSEIGGTPYLEVRYILEMGASSGAAEPWPERQFEIPVDVIHESRRWDER